MMTMLSDTLLLDARTGWRKAYADAALELNGALQLRRVPSSIRPLVDASGSFGGLTNPGGLAIDPDGRIYILDADGTRICRYDACACAFETLPCIGGRGSKPRELNGARGIDISCNYDLFVADTGNARVQVFALKGLPLRAIWNDPKAGAKPWEPWDLVVARDGRVFVTDRANGLVHRYDCHGTWRGAFGGLTKPTHIAIDSECRLYVIQDGSADVLVFDAEGKLLETITKADQAADRFCPTHLAVDADGNLCIADANGALWIADADTHEPRACRAALTAGGLAFDKNGEAIVTDADRKRICTLDSSAAYETSGAFLSEALDSRMHNCQWHRVVLRGTLVAGTKVRVDTFTSESPKTIEEIRALPEARWATRQAHTIAGGKEWDCLVLSVPGRYLWLRLTLTGNGAATPEIASVRAYFPRASSLRYLPAVYSEDAVSRDFLGRFLSIFDTVRDTVSARIANIAAYFDPASAPDDSSADFLAWLGSWVGMALDRHWPEARRRALLKNAHRLYELRGTPEGLRLHIELYTGRKPQILEHFKLRRWTFLGSSRLGDCSALYGSSIVKRLQLGVHDRIGEFQLIDSGDPLRDPFYVYAHQFTVVVPASKPMSKSEDAELQRRTLERIIEMAKPAHTKGDLQVTEGRLRIGIQSFIGVDTIISDYPAEVVEGTRRLGFDAVLGPSEEEARPPAMRVGVRTRIGAGTVLR
jgi:phage tail-like protein